MRLVQLPRDLFLAQFLQFFFERAALLHQLVRAQSAEIVRLRPTHAITALREMKRVWTGSLDAAKRIDSLASDSGRPSTSKRIFPRFTTQTQDSTIPLPFPIRVSAGFLVTGLSG